MSLHTIRMFPVCVVLLIAALAGGQAMAQTVQTATIAPIRTQALGGSITVNPTATWDAAKGAWLVNLRELYT